MKTPKFETATGALAVLLGTKQFVYADLYTISLIGGGTTLRYCTADIDVGYSGLTFSHKGPLFDRKANKASARWKIGIDVDTWSVVVMPRITDPITGAATPDKIGNQPWLVAARTGMLDGATVLVDRFYAPVWPAFPFNPPFTPTGVINIFTGRVATVEPSRTQVVINLNSHLELLGVLMPKNIFQAGCRFTLFDIGCTLNPASFVVAGSALAGSTQNVINSAIGAPGGSGTYALGRIVMTSGANNGISRSVRTFGGGQLALLAPLPFAVTAGDTFNAYPGCNKTDTACTAFGNLVNFGGQKLIPAPEVAI